MKLSGGNLKIHYCVVADKTYNSWSYNYCIFTWHAPFQIELQNPNLRADIRGDVQSKTLTDVVNDLKRLTPL